MMMNPLFGVDFYKTGHGPQYPEGTTEVFSNFTPRGSRIEGVEEVVLFSLQYYMYEYLVGRWQWYFFDQPKEEVVKSYRDSLVHAGLDIDCSHIEALHDLGYLPLEFWALPEGTAVPIRCPMFVVRNTHPDFFWLTNYIETQLSATIWGPCTSATLAREYRKIFMQGMLETGGDPDFVDYMGHDFSFRGMYGTEAAAISGGAHLLSFNGTDTLPAIEMVCGYYGASPGEVGGSIPATEHSVMCMGEEEHELDTFRRLLTEIYPTGPVSIVSDTWDYWKVLTETLPALKDLIMERDGKLVIRPDSGDPADIICGTALENAEGQTPEEKGTFQILWEIFGGTTTDKGFKLLDDHIGAIYGDSITLERARDITERLMLKSFVPNMVYGIGSFTYQYNTRDTFGFAMKATCGVVNGQVREIFKDPKTDDGEKKSLKGYVAVRRDENGKLYAQDQVSWADVENCEFKRVFYNGHVADGHNKFHEIRARVRA